MTQTRTTSPPVTPQSQPYELFTRSPANPVLTAAQWPYPAAAVYNPAATVVDGETVLLCRVEDHRGFSHLTVARSSDGVTGWRIDPRPLIAADTPDQAHCVGAQDPRITRIDELGIWLIAYTTCGPAGPCVTLAVTDDFHTVQHVGMAMPPEDGNAAMLPRRIGGQFILLHRPRSPMTKSADVWLSRSVDLRSWSAPEAVLTTRPGDWWDSTRVGIGPPPLETPHGWLCLYHGVHRRDDGPLYRIGVVLLDLDDPARVLRRSEGWVFGPAADYERSGNRANVVLPTGLVHDPASDQLRMYYGAADTVVALATAPLTAVLDHVLACPASEPAKRR
jgi:beta-1,2-mannobiose phosphorylase / 1,2-beta-oligomannan phosphorylase